MKLVLFYDNEMYVEQWKDIMGELVDHDSITVDFSSLFETYNMEDSFFSIFLLTPQQAASQPLLEHVKALMEAGAHEKSMLFIINDKDQVTLEERAIITTEIKKILTTFVVEPELLWCSSRGYSLYQTFINNHQDEMLKKELRYTYWNKDGEAKTLQEMMNSHLMSLVLEDSCISTLADYVEHQYLSFPQRTNRRDPSKQHIMLIGDNRLIRDALAEQKNLVIHELECLEQLEKEVTYKDHILLVINYEQVKQYDYTILNTFPNVFVLIDGGKHRNVWEIEQEEISQLTGKHPNISFTAVNSFYIECLKLEKTREELIDDSFIVIRGQHGFPVYKDDISDWDEALLQESGMPDVFNVIS